jgi:outer membrane protein TolC
MKKKVNNMKKYKFLFKTLLLLLFCSLKMNAQEILTLQDAVKIALENNYEIKIATNNLNIDKTNVASGNAGMLPKIIANVTDNNAIQNLSQTRADGTILTLDNAKNASLNYGVGLDWTVFDGFKMFAKYDQLKELQKLAESQLKLAILSKISALNSTYFDLVQQQQQLSALDTTIVISNQRLTLAQNRFTIGKASKLEVLNAQVDLNTDTVALLRQKELYANTKVLLNQILARDAKNDFKVQPEITVDSQLKLPELIALAEKQNPQLASQIITKRISELQLKQIKAARYPTLKVTSGYTFVDSRSDLGFTTQSSARGLNYGFGASLNLFDGFAQKRNEKVAKIAIENATIVIDQQNLALKTELTTSFQTYLTNLELIALEAKNEAIAKQNLTITLDKFRIGTITTLEFRTAQLNYINAKVRFNDAQYQAKISEIALKELAGNLSLY